MSILEDPEENDAKAKTIERPDNDELIRLRIENEALKAKMGKSIDVTVQHDAVVKSYAISLKVSEKGAVSIYGGGKFPVTVYPMFLLAILGISAEIQDFMVRESKSLAWTKSKPGV
jgi:hypothetical protein